MAKLNKAQADAWKKHASSNRPAELELPSGLTAIVRAPGMQSFLSRGMIPNSLIPLIKEQLDAAAAKGKGKQQDKPAPPEQDPRKMMEEVIKDPKKLQDMFALADAIALDVVVEPQLHELGEGDEYDKDKIYVSEIPLDDKMFIFSYAVGGAKQVESFRDGKASMLEPVQELPATASKTKRTGKTTKKSR